MAESRSDPKPPKGEADPPNLGNDNADSEIIKKMYLSIDFTTVQNVSALSVVFMIFFFLSLRFYVKSIFGIVEEQNLPFKHI